MALGPFLFDNYVTPVYKHFLYLSTVHVSLSLKNLIAMLLTTRTSKITPNARNIKHTKTVERKHWCSKGRWNISQSINPLIIPTFFPHLSRGRRQIRFSTIHSAEMLCVS